MMNHLIICLIVLYAAANCEATVFSWGSSTETKEPKLPEYSPILNVRKYNTIQIDPAQKPPYYFPNVPDDSNKLEGQTTQLSQDQIQQFDLINKLSRFFPEADRLQEMDLSTVLPYFDLISENSLESFKNIIEAIKQKEKTKLWKIIGYLKYLKEKKLQTLKYLASLGSSLAHKKKNLLEWGSSSKTTLEPHTETSPLTFPTYDTYNPYLAPRKSPFVSSHTAPTLQQSLPALPSFSYYPHYSINTQNLPNTDKFPSAFPLQTVQKKRNETPAELPDSAKSPLSTPLQFPSFSPTFQFPTNFVSTQYQPLSSALAQNSPFQTQNQYQYPSLPAQPADSTLSEIIYTYQPFPDSTHVFQDTIRQSASNNQSELPTTSVPNTEQSSEPQYSYQSNRIPSLDPSQQSLPLPKYENKPWHLTSFPNSNDEPNKFYTSLINDFAVAGSENIEKREGSVKSDNSDNSQNDFESSKVNNAVTTTETSISKSQPVVVSVPIRKTPPYFVYPSLLEEADLKDDGNKSTSAVTVPLIN